MAEGDVHIYHSYRDAVAAGTSTVDLVTDTLKMMLVTSSYTPDIVNDDFLDNVTSEVILGVTYTPSGGPTLATKAMINTADYSMFDFADVTVGQDIDGFTNARYFILYKDTGTAATSPLVALGEFGSNKSIVLVDLVITIPVAGLFGLYDASSGGPV